MEQLKRTWSGSAGIRPCPSITPGRGETHTQTAFQRHGGNPAQIQLKQGNSAWISSASLGANLALVIEQKKKLNQHFSFYVEGLEVILVVWLP